MRDSEFRKERFTIPFSSRTIRNNNSYLENQFSGFSILGPNIKWVRRLAGVHIHKGHELTHYFKNLLHKIKKVHEVLRKE
jgi:hypothetical protein